jgi:uncharacterized RDD family membrane protein YckC
MNSDEELNDKNKDNSDSDKQKEPFSNELEQQKKELDAEHFAKQQEQYRNIISDTQNMNIDINDFANDPYIWRIGFGRRFGATIIDSIFLALFLIVAAMVTGIAEEFMYLIPEDSAQMMLTMDQMMEFWIHRFLPLNLAVSIIYFSMEIIFGQTIGKMLLGIVIGTEDKRFASYKELFIRFSIKHIDFYFSLFLIFGSISTINNLSAVVQFIVFIGYFFVFGMKKQTLHDMISKTAIYYKDELEQFDNLQKRKI